MKYFGLLVIGVFFGIVLTKSEVISWYRIQEMFYFDSFHMYGIIGSAVILTALVMYLLKRGRVRSTLGEPIEIEPKPKQYRAALMGGTLFGLGWALTGACPGPIYIIIGYGYLVFLIVLIFALLGAFTYGLVRRYLPH